ncbi:DUF305 domain-containing protein [Streptomyces sp. V4I23]|uniref:DUF305 domain-containing protein n=1 Tax=Streptomyces sp. V4I23 TaxID=3042282 RepID=UPI0027D829E6|nr:DUF305 domain-containing protein [Streptomyces sp. V4I23]
MPQEVAVLKPRRSARTRTSFRVAAVAAALVLAACDADSGTRAEAGADKGAPVLAPGKPGEPAKTLSAEEAAKAVPDDSPNAADFRYAQMMIKHHEQALEMTSLAEGRAGSQRIERLAGRIAAAQEPEVGAMRAWLETHGGDSAGAHEHDHASMPGMATDAQLDQLRHAEGTAFDELFLKLMITHHQGALTMAAEVLSSGNNVAVEEMANDVIAQQTSEIGRMRAL